MNGEMNSERTIPGQALGVEQHQREPDPEDELEHQRQHEQRNGDPQPVPEFVVGDQLGVIGEAGKGLLAGRGESLEAEPDRIDDRKRDHRDREDHGRRREGRHFQSLSVPRYCRSRIRHASVSLIG
ncbi:hypothetical protein ACVWZZ_007551 [Bradyrhizobium sp. LM6.10]